MGSGELRVEPGKRPEDRVRCPKCGNIVRRADLEPCSALNHDVPDFRLVKKGRSGK